jgi:Uma2 family endonuclease
MIIERTRPRKRSASKNGEPLYSSGRRPTWELARFFPVQGEWTADEYLALESVTGDNIRAELSNGRLEVLPMPTHTHQRIILLLLSLLEAFCKKHAPGELSFSGIRVRLKSRGKAKFREPDVVYMKKENAHRCHEEFWEGADLVAEVVSGSKEDRKRDYVDKRKDYAAAGISEYWIIDPDKKRIRVFVRKGKKYEIHGDFKAGDRATSKLLRGFSVKVDDVFAAERGKS